MKHRFNISVPLDEKLSQLCALDPKHKPIGNPALHLIYQYQVDLVDRFAFRWFCKDIKKLRVLDWGCGKGHVTYLLRKRFADPISCDFHGGESDDDSSFGQATPIIKSEKINVVKLQHEYRLPFEDNSFDIVLSFGVLEHVPNERESLREIRRVLAPDGLLFCFNLPYYFSWTQRLLRTAGDDYHDRLYLKSRTKDLLSEFGFRIIDMWHRQLFPKNRFRYPAFRIFELIDQFTVNYTPLKFFATNIEFVATTTQVPEDRFERLRAFLG
jgi:SAM-dependent methyltransferase